MRSSRSQIRYGLLIDIGSGSIGFAIVTSDPKKKQPTILWEKREYARTGNISSVSDALKPLLSTLTDMSMLVAQEGIRALQQQDNKAVLDSVLVTISAPWAYTVNRPIIFKQDTPFAITEELVEELEASAAEDALQQFTENHPNFAKEITETSRAVLETYANGYRLSVINKQTTNNLQINHSIALVNKTLQRALEELQEKLFPGVPLHITSSMTGLHYATRSLQPHSYDTCLVDITSEATEIGIVRNGSLTYSSHTAFGTHSLAREFAESLKRPIGEVTARLQDFLTDKSITSHTAILEAYQEQLVQLFKETGDSLAIPNNVQVLVDKHVAEALVPHIQQAAVRATKTSTTITSLGELVVKKKIGNDSALAVTASFFHTLPKQMHFHFT